jgi:hypothetical protein
VAHIIDTTNSELAEAWRRLDEERAEVERLKERYTYIEQFDRSGWWQDEFLLITTIIACVPTAMWAP